MRLVHLSDVHLGYRQYQRLTPAGINQREADVAAAFKSVVDQTIEIEPDLIVIAGDLFHTVRPSNPAILWAFQQFIRLQKALPKTPIVLIAGNHDLPRTSETGCILGLFSQLGVRVVDKDAKRIDLPEIDASVLAIPDMAGPLPALDPNPDARYNVLVLHGETPGLPEWLTIGDRSRVEIPLDLLRRTDWDYIALGHYHIHQQVGEHAWYSGAVEVTNDKPWIELKEERHKGFVEHDLDSGKHRFHKIVPARQHIDLLLKSYQLPPAEIDSGIATLVAKCQLDGNIVRVVLQDAQRHVLRDLNHAAIREYKRRALHFQIDVRRPDAPVAAANGAAARRMTLQEVVREKLEARTIEADLDRAALISLGLGYLKDAESAEVPE
jgi:DNA repair protein SbcD/Mre11